MRRRHHHTLTLPRREIFICALVALLAVLLVISYAYRAQSGRSVEVSFTDPSEGMQIVPASCASPPPPTALDNNTSGYELTSGTNQAEIVNPKGTTGTLTGVTDYFCVTNTSGNNYFLPAETHTELQDFLNAPPPGVTVQNPGPDNP